MHRKTLEHGSSIIAGNEPVGSDNFPQFPAESIRRLLENSGKFSAVILLPSFYYFPCLPAGSDDSPTSFLQDPERFGDRNDCSEKIHFLYTETKSKFE